MHVVSGPHSAATYAAVARLHAANLDQGFLATLGERFLSLLYRAIDESEGFALIVAIADERIVGFVSAGRGMGPVYRRMLRHPFALARALLPSTIHPGRLWRILEILRYGRTAEAARELPRDELLSIAVDPEWRGRSVAETLYVRLLAHFRQQSSRAIRIVVGESLAAAHRFYRRMGAVAVARVEVHRGVGSTVYVHELD